MGDDGDVFALYCNKSNPEKGTLHAIEGVICTIAVHGLSHVSAFQCTFLKKSPRLGSSFI